MSQREASDLSRRVMAALEGHQRLCKKIGKPWTWTQVEKAAGISHSTMQRYLAGQSDIRADKFIAVCVAVGVDPGEIMEDVVRKLPAGYLESLVAEVPSVPADNVTELHPRDMTVEQLEEQRHAAKRDDEAATDEPEGL